MERHDVQEVRAQLQSLRQLFVTEGGGTFVELFDEFIEQGEFGLAVHEVCDFILRPDSPPVSQSTIDVIQRLHAAMKIDDRCADELQRRVAETSDDDFRL